jgi:copper(I)-binding protein
MFTRALILIALVWPHAAQASEFKAGNVVITSPWTRATPERAKVGGGFMVLTNTGKEEDRLIGASADISGSVEIHEMHLVNGVMMMRHNNPGIPLKPGSSVTFKPFSHHLMFMDLKQPLVAGHKIKGKLRFQKAGEIEVEYEVLPLGANGPAQAAR